VNLFFLANSSRSNDAAIQSVLGEGGALERILIVLPKMWSSARLFKKLDAQYCFQKRFIFTRIKPCRAASCATGKRTPQKLVSARHSTLTVSLSTQVYKWVPAN